MPTTDSKPTSAVATAFDAHFGEQLFRWAKPRKSALQEVEADEGSEGEEPIRDEDRAAVVTEGEGKQDEITRHDADDAFDGHD